MLFQIWVARLLLLILSCPSTLKTLFRPFIGPKATTTEPILSASAGTGSSITVRIGATLFRRQASCLLKIF